MKNVAKSFIINSAVFRRMVNYMNTESDAWSWSV